MLGINANIPLHLMLGTMPTPKIFCLPLEIRQIVYDYSLNDVRYTRYHLVRPLLRMKQQQTGNKRRRLPGIITASVNGKWPTLLGVNRRIRKETIKLILICGTFNLDFGSSDIAIPDAFLPMIQQASCGYLSLSCRRNIYTFHNLRRVTCQLYLPDNVLRRYGYAPTTGPDTPSELEDVILYGLNPAHHWTLAHAGYSVVMKMCKDKTRWFRMRLLVNSSWWVGGPEVIQVRPFSTLCTCANQNRHLMW